MNRIRFVFFLSLVLTVGIFMIIYHNVDDAAKNVYFDLGANNGDSIENFLNMNYLSNGGDIRSKIPAEKLNKKWTIYAIEGNSAFDLNLLYIKNKYKITGHEIILYNGTIVSNYDGFITFYIDQNNQYGNQVGSSVLANHPDIILSKKVNVKKPCIDFARLLRVYSQKDFIVVKMDIEGAEFDLLIHLIKENVLSLIDVLVVEYHRYLSPFKSPNDVFSAIFKQFKIKEEIWN